MTQEQIIDIINITYSRIMQLKFSHLFMSSIFTDGNIAHDYPNLCYSIQSSFATDAYTTVDGLLATGDCSFGFLSSFEASLV